MARQARRKSRTGIYHIMMRGVNKQTIFESDMDNYKFMKIVREVKNTSDFNLLGYCLMGNHVHFLMKENEDPISHVMQRISTNYAAWYNWKNERVGHLFQDRFKSEVVEDERYLLTVSRYIHQNPVKAQMVNSTASYKWSSYNEYLGYRKIVDVDLILRMFSQNSVTAAKKFMEYTNMVNEDKCLDFDKRLKLTEEELAALIENEYGVKAESLSMMEKDKAKNLLKKLKILDGTSIRQIVKVTGVSKYFVEHA